MLQKYDNTLIIKVKKSRSLVAAVAFIHLGALAVLAGVDGYVVIRLGLALAVVASGYLNIQHLWRLRGRRTVTGLEWRERGDWAVSFALAPDWQPAHLLSATVFPWLVVLVLRAETGARASVVLTRDAVDRETFRRLRGRLRLGVPAAA